MKKSMIASIVALGMASGFAQAAEQDVTFTGSVTAVTCDLVVSGEGANANLPNQVALGTAKKGERAGAVEFAFKPAQTAGNQSSCDDMESNGKATITWFGSNFNGTALANASGTATDALVEVKALNADAADNNKVVSASGTAHNFPASLLKTGGEGLKYSAELVGGQEAGSVDTTARYAFSYK
ncbi:TPA: fimbrial protein [Yersinia enterocolitica]|nr:fimbrial protein [Yersinia enterocolitica]HEI6739904.1 fimbrial protein [Yersinia enterocolitica]